jgi:hypothetical protein
MFDIIHVLSTRDATSGSDSIRLKTSSYLRLLKKKQLKEINVAVKKTKPERPVHTKKTDATLTW